MKRSMLITVLSASVLTVPAACGDDNSPAVANPAAVFCEKQGGTTSGPEPMCKLPDGSIVDAWEYYRTNAGTSPGIANPAAVFCESKGGTTSGPEPMCKLPDGSIVDAWEYFRTNNNAG